MGFTRPLHTYSSRSLALTRHLKKGWMLVYSLCPIMLAVASFLDIVVVVQCHCTHYQYVFVNCRRKLESLMRSFSDSVWDKIATHKVPSYRGFTFAGAESVGDSTSASASGSQASSVRSVAMDDDVIAKLKQLKDYGDLSFWELLKAITDELPQLVVLSLIHI